MPVNCSLTHQLPDEFSQLYFWSEGQRAHIFSPTPPCLDIYLLAVPLASTAAAPSILSSPRAPALPGFWATMLPSPLEGGSLQTFRTIFIFVK